MGIHVKRPVKWDVACFFHGACEIRVPKIDGDALTHTAVSMKQCKPHMECFVHIMDTISSRWLRGFHAMSFKCNCFKWKLSWTVCCILLPFQLQWRWLRFIPPPLPIKHADHACRWRSSFRQIKIRVSWLANNAGWGEIHCWTLYKSPLSDSARSSTIFQLMNGLMWIGEVQNDQTIIVVTL